MGTSGPPPQEFNEHSISRNSNYIASLNVGAPSVHDIQFGSLEMSLSRTLGSRDSLSDDGVNEGDEEQAKEGQASAEGGLEEDEPSSESQDNLNILVEECGPEVSSGNNVIESHASEKGGSNNIIRSSEAGEKKGLSLEGEQMLVEVFGEEHMDNPVLSGMESNVEKSKHVFDLNEVQNDVAQDEPVATSIQQNNEKGMTTGGISKHRRKKKVTNGVHLLIQDYPYAVDGLEIWSSIKTWVQDYCKIYYKSDELKDKPWWQKMQTVQELINSCTIIIWIASINHLKQNTWVGECRCHRLVAGREARRPAAAVDGE
nr:probable linoleate 9S-lipoxygenase 5 [Ipomoea batatas]